MGDILAYEGKFKEASRFYEKAGRTNKALSMYTDMRMFDLARVSAHPRTRIWSFQTCVSREETKKEHSFWPCSLCRTSLKRKATWIRNR